MTRSCCGTTPAGATCTGSRPARSRFWSDSLSRLSRERDSRRLATRLAAAPHFLLRPAPEPRVRSFCRFAVAALLCPCGLMTLASAQRLDTATPLPPAVGAGAAAERYEPVFEALRKLAPRGDSVATVRNLTLQRDAIQFRFAEGRLYLLTPVAGRTVGAVFVGRGAVSFVPPLAVERAQLSHVLGDSVLNTEISAAVLVFTDSTLWELTRQLSFGPAAVGGDATGPVGDALDRLLEGRSHESESSTLMSALLNGYANGFFYGHVKRARGEDLIFQVDPEQPEQIELLRGGKLDGQKVQIVSQFPRVEDLQDSVLVGVERPDPLKLERYQVDTTLGKDLEISAKASIRVTARRSEEHTSELQSRLHLVCRLLLEKKKKTDNPLYPPLPYKPSYLLNT